MNFLRPAVVVLFALLVPGGLVVLVPMFYRLFADARNRRRVQAGAKLTPARGSGDS